MEGKDPMEETVACYPFEGINIPGAPARVDTYEVTRKDKRVLRDLAYGKAEIASLPVHGEKAAMWAKLNGLERTRPLIWINEIPWHEMDVDGELTLTTTTPFARLLEMRLRRTIYQWRHMPADMVVEPTLACYYRIHDSGFGIDEVVDIARTDAASDIYSRHFVSQIQDFDDLEKIRMPRVVFDAEATEAQYQSMLDIFDGLLTIDKRGTPGFWFSPWDELIRWWGVQDALLDMVDRPALVHAVMQRLTKAYLTRLDQYEEQHLLSPNNGNYRIGSGGLGYTNELPLAGFDPKEVRARDLWGCGTAQIFSTVSPQMHDEFALQYEIQWMERFGLNYYGCCEPLDMKVDLLRRVPNLRKISMSPWADLDRAADRVGRDLVISWKPSPSIFVGGSWHPEAARAALREGLAKLKHSVVEVIMKDVSSVEYQPQRLWEWSRIAVEEAMALT